MELKTLNRFTFRQIHLPQEYHLRIIRCKHIIQEITKIRPTNETMLMCLVDEFLNLHDPKEVQE